MEQDYKELLVPEIYKINCLTNRTFIKQLDHLFELYEYLYSNYNELFTKLVTNYRDNKFVTFYDIVHYIVAIHDKTKYCYVKLYTDSHNALFKFITLNTSDITWEKIDNEVNEYKQKHKKFFELLDDFYLNLTYAVQDYDNVIKRINIKLKKYDEDSFDNDKMPSLNRANLCSMYIPVDELSFKHNIGDNIKCINDRTKKIIEFKITKRKFDDNYTYECVDKNNKIYWITSYDNVKDAWDCLFPINKDIYSGWWNKTLRLIK